MTGANVGAQDALANLRGQIGTDLLRNPPGIGDGTTPAATATQAAVPVIPQMAHHEIPPGGVGRKTSLGGFYRPGPPTVTKPKKPKSLARALTPSYAKRAL